MMIKKRYHQVWKEIFKIVDNGNGEVNLREKIILSDRDIPTDEIIKISLLEENNKFYLELALNHLSYKL